MNPGALAHLLTENTSEDRIVAWREGQSVSLRTFRHDVAVAARHFKACQAAALLCKDSYLFSIGFFGLLHAGARIVLPPQTQTASLNSLQGAYELLADDQRLAALSGTEATLSSLDPSCDCIELFTSGSTAQPQKILKNLRQLETEIALLEQIWGRHLSGGAVHATVSHQHIYGLTFKVLWPLAAKRAFAAETHILWENITASLTPENILISSPAHLGRLHGITALPANKKPKAVFTAGAPLLETAAQQAETILGCVITEIFGSTETGAIAMRLPAQETLLHPLPGIEIRTGANQELELRSPYAGADWVTTGDKIEQLGDGFRFLGRTGAIVKIEGKRVSLAAIEARLTSLAEIDDAVAVMVPGMPERLAAAVILSNAGKDALARLGAFQLSRSLREQLLAAEDAAGVPRLWRFVDTFPSQPMGKRRAQDIIALFLDNAP